MKGWLGVLRQRYGHLHWFLQFLLQFALMILALVVIVVVMIVLGAEPSHLPDPRYD